MMESSPAILHFYKKQRNVHTEKKKKKRQYYINPYLVLPCSF